MNDQFEPGKNNLYAAREGVSELRNNPVFRCDSPIGSGHFEPELDSRHCIQGLTGNSS
jgi:hypothetical protein